MQTLGQLHGFAGLFISCILSASLSTISSGVNSMATVIVEDIYKRISIARPMSNERQATVSKILCKCHFFAWSQMCYLWIAAVGIGLLTIFLAFIVSYIKSNIITVSFVLKFSYVFNYFLCFLCIQIVLQLVGAFTAPVLGIYLLGLFTTRVQSRVNIINRIY